MAGTKGSRGTAKRAATGEATKPTPQRRTAKRKVAPKSSRTITRKKAAESITAAGQQVYGDIIKRRKKPSMRFPVRSLSNVRYDPRRGHFEIRGKTVTRTLSYNTVKTFAQSVRLMAVSKDLIRTDEIATKREVYYVSKNWGECRFNEQPESDTVMDDVEAMFAINREQLGFIPEEDGGAVAGRLVIVDTDPDTGRKIRVNCAKMGTGAYNIPASVEHFGFETKAKFILAVETAGMFQRLVKHKYYDTANCVLVSMKGVPSRATRRFVRRLADEHKLPVCVFTYGDPYGYCNIYRTLKVGSGNAAHINRFFCVPQAQFLGVTPQDIVDYGLEDTTHPLEPVDIKRAKDALKNDPFVRHHKEWQDALNEMLRMGVRIEQQAFAKHGLNFVLERYLPEKLKKKSFLP
ncbi:MAG: DNA topoisomerase IV subunit A [Lentisphaerae bacterium]|nr:DNA topoisomerase IV subunit A [Lentisphaerota bacterium]